MSTSKALGNRQQAIGKKRPGLVVGSFFAAGVFLFSGCAPRPERTVPAASATARAPAAPRCPDRIDRAKTGGFVSGLFGTAIATLVGSPVLGVLYQVAGYGIGFASADACKKTEVAAAKDALTPENGQVAVEKAVLPSPNGEVTVEKAVLTPQPQQRRPVLVSTEITEENLPSGRRP